MACDPPSGQVAAARKPTLTARSTGVAYDEAVVVAVLPGGVGTALLLLLLPVVPVVPGCPPAPCCCSSAASMSTRGMSAGLNAPGPGLGVLTLGGLHPTGAHAAACALRAAPGGEAGEERLLVVPSLVAAAITSSNRFPWFRYRHTESTLATPSVASAATPANATSSSRHVPPR
eukprot:CAMPEP_0202920198 /NCGR_PEP_ID=MMETSP1392-20130828/76732_1 /ASSEMBLY_ACC=CAM_ASM_000868 /TAXON_ID=225041 /ORGANISM="Chlamydomonas chlamydogama, Strain SAG 11-48b" /LENGTH=173 /DNA_ID=CAMNT_0049613683 /DNA_START=769 /DNA_END=1285 /DNA_ORIENTATION=-